MQPIDLAYLLHQLNFEINGPTHDRSVLNVDESIRKV